MLNGLLGSPVPHVGGAEAWYAASATVPYSPAIETTLSYGPVLDDRGRPLEVRFTLVSARLVLVRFSGRLTKATNTDELSVVIADLGSRLQPSPELPDIWLEDLRWVSFYIGTSSMHQVSFEVPILLGPGPHALQVWREAASGISATTWGDRHLIAEVLAP